MQMISTIKTIAEIKKSSPLNEYQQNKLSQAYSLYFANEQIFLNLMEDIVDCYETRLQNYVGQLKTLSWIGAGFILIVMFINGRFVVYKSIKEVNEQFLEINNHKEFQATILSCSLDGIISINTLGCITLMNKTAEKFFLGQEVDYLGKRISAIIPEFPFNTLGTLQDDYAIELECRKKGGLLFPTLINISKIETGKRQGWVIFVKNLSIRKKIELELDHAKQKILDAVEANNAKSQFLANMSHELRTPLNSIIGFAQLLETDKESPLLPEHADYVNYIHQAGTHLLSLINEILDLAKLEHGKLSLSLEMVNISKVVKEVQMLIYTLASKKHIQIISQFDSMPDYYIVVDRVRIKQVLLNLLSNAIKYNKDHGSIHIAVDRNDQFLKISVIDSGRGISESKISQLFDPFNRLGAENSEIEGTGIGLTITKSLVEDMHGQIGVFSEEHKGSTFWVEFPLAENHKDMKSIRHEETISQPQLLDSTNVVYIDDDSNLKQS
jgi:signal transduction histidine kinase